VDPTTLKKKQDKGAEQSSTLSVNGRVFLQRTRYYSPAQGSSTPSDDLLDAVHNTISLATRQLCCQLNRASRSFEMTAQNLKKAAQLSLSHDTVRQAVEDDGKALLEMSRRGQLQPSRRSDVPEPTVCGVLETGDVRLKLSHPGKTATPFSRGWPGKADRQSARCYD